MAASVILLQIQPGTQISNQVFIGSKPGLFITQVRGKSLHFFECFFYSRLRSRHWARRMNKTKFCAPLSFCSVGQRQTVNKWTYNMPVGTTRKKDAGGKNGMQLGVESGGVRGCIFDQVTLKRNKNYPWDCKNILWPFSHVLKTIPEWIYGKAHSTLRNLETFEQEEGLKRQETSLWGWVTLFNYLEGSHWRRNLMSVSTIPEGSREEHWVGLPERDLGSLERRHT